MDVRYQTRQILRQLDLRPSRKMGQNFLVSEKVIKEIGEFAALDQGNIVFEIGPGLGCLTQYFASRVAALWAVEKDRRLYQYLRQNMRMENLLLIREDVLKIDLKKMLLDFCAQYPGKRLCIIGNLPYRIATEIVFRFLEIDEVKADMIFMLQKELVTRFMAYPKEASFGELSLKISALSKIDCGVHVSKNMFHPIPKVDSLVIRLIPCKYEHGLDERSEHLLWQVINLGFAQRRKMLKNALTNSKLFPYTVEQIVSALEACSMSPRTRAEEIDLDGYINFMSMLRKS